MRIGDHPPSNGIAASAAAQSTLEVAAPATPKRRRPATENPLGMPPSRKQRADSPGRATSTTTSAHEVLIDNRAAMQRMGVEHPLLNRSWDNNTPVAPLQGGNRPTPAGEIVRRSNAGPARTANVQAQPAPAEPPAVRQARTEVKDVLKDALAKLKHLDEKNIDPVAADFVITDLDRTIAPLLVASENWRNRGLNLVSLHTDTAEHQSPPAGSINVGKFMASAPPGRYRAIIDDGAHTRAADIRKDASGASVIVTDPLRKEKNESDYEDYATFFNEEFGERTKCAFIPLDLQKSSFGCRIFSISLALKMHSRKETFTAFHDTLRTGAEPGSQVSQSRRTEELGTLLVLDAAPLVDAGMMKHSHAGSSVKQYLQAHPEQAQAVVNKRNETLTDRTTRHLVTRHIDTQDADPNKRFKQIRFNKSIELKRMTMINRAIAYTESAPPQHVLLLSKRLAESRANAVSDSPQSSEESW
ncbi:YopJ family acetyltransferase [Collimonas silvisoli]|uniref:YopJ family acetyltransferase n=1 Tax=Collimonas silvisoli TaxID=2825884 RepID=UPI001B8DA596|nr:YopJ family acetyltransferase [Collimonas silvisoli]